jgi:pimeloyl-ACP methyl ester carboxylesterase
MACLSALLGCTSYAHERLLREGEIDVRSVDSGYFQHQLFRATAPAPGSDGNRLHIYLGGDGRPWRTPRQIASDPTSTRSVMLENMLRGDSESLYIGRPCYYQVTDARCGGRWWTHDRYHPEVVNSLLKVIEQLAANHEELWLIGHSGGGALAVLLGRRLDRPVKVVTVSANLDHQAWTEYHQYSPLSGSLNPIRDRVRNPDMQELHWYATEDRNILPEWVLAYCHKHQTQCLPVPGSHSDGWPAQWPTILRCSHGFFAQQQGGDAGLQGLPVPIY